MSDGFLLKVLVDNNTCIDQYFLGEPALSFYIEQGGRKILFDTGYSDVLVKNAQLLDVRLDQVDTIVFSHGHNDHTRGIGYLKDQFDLSEVTVIAHPDALKSRYFEGESIGNPYSKEMLESFCKVSLSVEPVKITENLIFLGEIPESVMTRVPVGQIKENEALRSDYVLDDTALVYQNPEGIFIITGCSHSGICNIIEHAKNICEEDRILGVMGGFHLFDVDSTLLHTIEYLKQNQVQKIYPCHCVSFPAKAEIHKYIPVQDVWSGMCIFLD
jgi:7,8-dihydropterin-6-yl-methyl-4-(beta-D-ribofuranosyl)aminobenzene 5'-phosphate synthase